MINLQNRTVRETTAVIEAANDERPALIGENLARCNPDDIPGMRLARGDHIRTLCQ